jgi:hypothetical protein
MGLAALVGFGVFARPAVARVTIGQSASILMFSKVIADGQRDTIIQITNTSNNMRHAHCFYVDGAPENPDAPVGPFNPPRWVETDFDIWLTKQQPTHWVVSTGRWDDPSDDTCRKVFCDPADSGTNNGNADCCDAGFDPGRVPPVGPHFTGELKCIEVDASGFPVPGNALKGEATLVTVANGEVSKYNAVGLRGFDTNNMDGTLCLGGGVSASCPSGAEYEACPQTWILDHPAIGAPDPVVDEQPFCTKNLDTDVCSSVSTTLTVVPCAQNFETQKPASVTLQFAITNEYEQTFSASTTITCWASYPLDQINDVFTAGGLAGTIVQTKMRSATGNADNPPHGVVAVIEEAHTSCPAVTAPAIAACTGGATTSTSYAAQNGHNSFADFAGQDLIVIPNDQIQVP